MKRIPDGAKPKLLKEVTFVLSKSNTKGGIKTVPNAVRYKCLYRLTAIRLANVDVAREDTVKVKEMVEEVERVECECFEASNGNKSTYLSKVAQFTKSNEFEKVTEEMFLPKGSMLQERRSETASTIDLAFCTFVRGSENIKFFRKAAKSEGRVCRGCHQRREQRLPRRERRRRRAQKPRVVMSSIAVTRW